MTTTSKLAPTLPSTARQPAVARPTTPAVATPAVSRPVAEPAVAFSGSAPPSAEALNPRGEHVARSASPGALWGEAGAERPRNGVLRQAMTEFRALPPDAQKARIEKLKGKQDALSKKMLARIETLDGKYKNLRNTTKTEVLRTFEGKTDSMTPTERTKLDGLLTKAEGIAEHIEDLKAQAATMPDSKTATPEEQAERKALASQIRTARDEHSKAVKAATTFVDACGLKAERLGQAEQRIDPKAPKPESEGSLLSMIGQWFHLDKLIHVFTAVFDLGESFNSSPQQRDAARERRKDEAVREFDQRIDQKRQFEKVLENAEVNSRRASLGSLNAALSGLSTESVGSALSRSR